MDQLVPQASTGFSSTMPSRTLSGSFLVEVALPSGSVRDSGRWDLLPTQVLLNLLAVPRSFPPGFHRQTLPNADRRLPIRFFFPSFFQTRLFNL